MVRFDVILQELITLGLSNPTCLEYDSEDQMTVRRFRNADFNLPLTGNQLRLIYTAVKDHRAYTEEELAPLQHAQKQILHRVTAHEEDTENREHEVALLKELHERVKTFEDRLADYQYIMAACKALESGRAIEAPLSSSPGTYREQMREDGLGRQHRDDD
jgi:hypothetical protein